MTKHQQDLLMDAAIRRTNPITIQQLSQETGLSDARVRSRVKYDVEDMGRAMMLKHDLVHFDLDKMADRTVTLPRHR